MRRRAARSRGPPLTGAEVRQAAGAVRHRARMFPLGSGARASPTPDGVVLTVAAGRMWAIAGAVAALGLAALAGGILVLTVLMSGDGTDGGLTVVGFPLIAAGAAALLAAAWTASFAMHHRLAVSAQGIEYLRGRTVHRFPKGQVLRVHVGIQARAYHVEAAVAGGGAWWVGRSGDEAPVIALLEGCRRAGIPVDPGPLGIGSGKTGPALPAP